MKTSNLIPVLAVLGYLAYSAINDQAQKSNTYQASKSSSGKASALGSQTMRGSSKAYGLRSTENSWPSSDETNDAIASNLLATNYYIVMDGSGSMADRQCSGQQTKLAAAKSALTAFAERIPNDANIGLYIFDNKGRSERVALGPNNKVQFADAVSAASANRGTPLKSAITAGYQALKQQASHQLGYGEYHLVIVTDGQPSSESEDPGPMVRDVLIDSPVVIHTIGFCIDDNHSLNQPGFTYYKAADNPEALRSGLDQVLAEAPDFNTDSFSNN